MLPETQHRLKTYLFWAILIGLLGLALLLVLPFIIAILSAYLLAYMARPIYERLSKALRPSLAAMACVVIAVILVVVPVSLVLIGMANQAGEVLGRQNISNYVISIVSHPLLRGFNLNVNTVQNQFNQFIADTTTSFLQSLPSLGLGLIVTLIGMYYFLCGWSGLSAELKKHIPSTNKERLVRELDRTTKAILYGTLVMAIAEFAIALIGFTLLGVDGAIIFAAIIFVLAFIPSIGPIMVWAPLMVYYLALQQYETAIGVGIIGLTLTIGIEVILYAKWIGDRTPIHPFVMMLGVISGIALFGIFGFIFGPLILATALEVIHAVHADE